MGHPVFERRVGSDSNLRHTVQRHCVHRASQVSRNMLFFHRVTDVEVNRRWAERHAPATRSCSRRQTSVQWHPPHECLAGAHSGDRGCHCSLWSQPSWLNLAGNSNTFLLKHLAIYQTVLFKRNIQWVPKVKNTLTMLDRNMSCVQNHCLFTV